MAMTTSNSINVKARFGTGFIDRFLISKIVWRQQRQSEGQVRVAGLGAHFAAATGNHDKLAAVDSVSGGRSVTAGGQIGFKEDFAVRLVEGSKSFVFGGADKHQTAAGHNRPAVVFRAGRRDAASSQFGEFTQDNLPEQFAPVEIDGV